MIVAGEASGDMNGSALALSLKKFAPHLKLIGIGGKNMREAGVEIIFDISELAVVGFTEVLRNIRRLRNIFRNFVRKMDEEKPAALILLDYPGFNIRLAERAKKKGITTIYYISPQVWAWGKNRVKKLAKVIDKMLVIFPFEKDFYTGSGLDVEFVGHPMLDRMKLQMTREELAARFALSASVTTVALLPGSRKQEIKRHLPIMLKAGIIMKKKKPDLQFILPCAPTTDTEEVNNIVSSHLLKVVIVENQTYEAINFADFVIASSGTATLESAYLGKPLIVIYKVSFVSFLIAKFLIKLRNVAMVNIIAGKKIVPEFLQFHARPSIIAREGIKLFEDSTYRLSMLRELEGVRNALGSPGASDRAANAILKIIS
jgi:lipid-A-disaccharide synthase